MVQDETKSVVTASSAYNAIGMRTLKEQKIHHLTYIMKNDPPIPDELTQKRMTHGSENEVSILYLKYIYYTVTIFIIIYTIMLHIIFCIMLHLKFVIH